VACAQERIDVRAADRAAAALVRGPWLDGGASSTGQQSFDFCMCNPPFFSSVSSVL
jgi:tRNA1(Val) A37 N6-methylase TrmN6